ncbi:MAG TPA: hypothetical protein IAC03_03470 [Candidatus Coprenecus pullistercoris]|nr:hypothetical protein [Candidatus Coprenecus pullistercoris]
MRKLLAAITAITALICYCSTSSAGQDRDTAYLIEIRQDIDRSSTRKLSLGLKEAERMGADYIILHLTLTAVRWTRLTACVRPYLIPRFLSSHS